jgi:hypothetical protein
VTSIFNCAFGIVELCDWYSVSLLPVLWNFATSILELCD